MRARHLRAPLTLAAALCSAVAFAQSPDVPIVAGVNIVLAVANATSSDKAPAVRLAAMYALQRAGQVQTHLMAAALADPEEVTQATEYLLELGRPAVPGIIEALKVAIEPAHRTVLAQLIGYLGGPEHRTVLEPMVSERDARVRRAATVALERIQRGS